MKRSEAIKNIVNVLRLTGNHYCDDGRDEQDAERILERLEAIEMLPPKVEVWNPDYPEFGISTKYVNIWEPEDDLP
jgi:hypothetical protein